MSFRRDKALQAAQQFATRGELDKAIREYQSVVEHDPNDVQSWLLLADSLHRAGDLDAAVDRYAHAANLWLEQGEIPNALQIFRQVLNLAPERYDLHLRTGSAFEQLRRYPEAVALYEKVAGVYLRSGNTREALMLYERVADLMPREIGKRLRLAELFSRERRVDDAIQHFQRGADFLRQAGRPQEYVRVAERLLYHRPLDEVSRELVRVYLELGQPRRALMKLNELLQRQQSDPEGLELLAETFVRLGKVDKACSVVIELVRGQREQGPAGMSRSLKALRRAVTWAPQNQRLPKLIAELSAALGSDAELEPSGLPSSPEPQPEQAAALDQDVEEIEEIEELEEFEEFEDFEDLNEIEPQPAALEPVAHTQPVARPSQGPSDPQQPEDDDDAPAAARHHSLTAEVISEGAQRSSDEVDVDLDKQLEEVRVLMKYHLFEHALGHAEQILATDPSHPQGLEMLAEILAALGRNEPAADARAALAQQLLPRDPTAAVRHVELALALIPDHLLAAELAAELASVLAAVPTAVPTAVRGERLSEVVGVADHEDALPDDDDPLGSLELDHDLLGDLLGDRLGTIEPSDSLIGRADPSLARDLGSDYRDDGDDQDDGDQREAIELELDAEGDIDIRAADPGLHGELNALRDDGDFAISVDHETPAEDDEDDDDFDFEDRFGLGGDDEAADDDEPTAEPTSEPTSEITSELGAPDLEIEGETTSVYENLDQPTIGRVEPEAQPEPESEPEPEPEPEADWPDLSAELDELEFYLAQDLEEDALAAYNDLVELFPGHPELAKIAHRFPDTASENVDAAAPLLDLEDDDDDDDFLAGIFDDAAPRERKQREVAIQTHEVEGADAGDRFDLGTAYREMGLLDKALAEYEIASRDPRWQAKALVMMGSLRLQTGDDQAATELFTRAVEAARTKDERCEANYELGMAYLASGRIDEAKQALALVEAGYRDRDRKLAEIA